MRASIDYECVALRKRSSVPQPDLAVGPGGGHQLAVGCESHGRDLAAMALERGYLGVDLQVPQFDGAVATARGQGLAVGSERQRPDDTRVALEADDHPPRGRLPQPHDEIRAGGGERVTIGREGQVSNSGLAIRRAGTVPWR